MKLAEMVDMINKAFLDAVIEKMDKLMNIGGFDLDGDVLIFCEDKEHYDDEVCVPFNMMALRAGDVGEMVTAISIIDSIESGEYGYLLTVHGSIDLSGVFE